MCSDVGQLNSIAPSGNNTARPGLYFFMTGDGWYVQCTWCSVISNFLLLQHIRQVGMATQKRHVLAACDRDTMRLKNSNKHMEHGGMNVTPKQVNKTLNKLRCIIRVIFAREVATHDTPDMKDQNVHDGTSVEGRNRETRRLECNSFHIRCITS